MHSPRYTNDIDYIFISFSSKKNVKELIKDELRRVLNLTFQGGLNSKAVHIIVNYGDHSAQIEISVEESSPAVRTSYSLLSAPYGRPSRIIRIQAPPSATVNSWAKETVAFWNKGSGKAPREPNPSGRTSSPPPSGSCSFRRNSRK